jgi:signal peptidase I
MKGWFKFLLAFAIAIIAMIGFRAMALTIFVVNGEGLEPEFKAGDRVLVNRWSYGLRTGCHTANGKLQTVLFSYGRICRQPVKRCDIVAYNDPSDSTHTRILLGRICALPGDTIRYDGRTILVPSIANCDDADYYWIKALSETSPIDSRYLGFIKEPFIIGRAMMTVYSHDPKKPIWSGYRKDRWFRSK